ncbi:CLIP domain-containing serine protease B15-like isoform X1 [Aricia agestis]|uniref:CLIP domain-containing serine protease B15-like isoform X1 n=1 Tax=Aricia agestis TaxID=91739 RepID=UPI001C207004|nr:CLIP domain-containing serine protease B15-like isoform X1 [Aricia agestis]
MCIGRTPLAYNMLFYIIVLCLVCSGTSLKRGDVCSVGGKNGVCKLYDECEYSKLVVNVNEMKPTLCGYEGKRRVQIACCPKTDSYPDTGPLRKYFQATDDGIMRWRDMTCMYDGTLPMVCCKDTVDQQNIESRVVEEPDNCPKFPNVKMNPNIELSVAESIAFEKCLSYRQYSNKCVASDGDPDSFTRANTCNVYVDRISGGREAKLKEFPHMAVIGCLNGAPNADAEIVWIGGGALISDKFILTAGHALFDLDHKRVKYALLGSLNKRNIREGVLYNIIQRIPYDTYDSSTKANDIALLKLDRRVKLSEFIRPACLPVRGVATHPDYVIAGWGQTTDKGNTSDVLMMIEAVSKDEQLCIAKFNQKNFRWNSERMLCVSGKSETQDSCRGDSGGPLMAEVQDSALPCTYFVAGVVSFGPECGQGAPGVYTNVAPYLDWIVRNVWPEEFRRRA